VLGAPARLAYPLAVDSETPMSTVRHVFELEVIKLLLQVAWADEQMAPEEAASLLAQAKGLGLTDLHLKELETYLSGQKPLPPPNLALLKGRRVEVLRAVKTMLQSDLRVAPEEDEILEQIALLLR
jgi:uncharacterized tellurite resistance protein B-like protein